MIRCHVALAAILLSITFRGSLRAQDSEPQGPASGATDNVVAYRDLEYARVGDTSLRLDVFVPKDVELPPLLVWIHGGAWQAGDKGNGGEFLPLTKSGFAVASIDYRLSSQAIFPAQIHDCKAAIRWLRAHAQQYGYNATRIGVGGASAGGHLVALMGTSGGDHDLEGMVGNHLDQSSRVQAVCDEFGPTDFLQMDRQTLAGARRFHDAADSPESRLVGGAIQENRDRVAKANPITYVDASDPPFLILHGDQDPLVPVHQSHLLTDALQKAGVSADFHVLHGAGHGGREFSAPEINAMILRFFENHLKGAPSPSDLPATGTAISPAPTPE